MNNHMNTEVDLVQIDPDMLVAISSLELDYKMKQMQDTPFLSAAFI